MNKPLKAAKSGAIRAQNSGPISQPKSGTTSFVVQAGPAALIQLDPRKLTDTATCVAELNRRYAVVKFGGKAHVMDEQGDTMELLAFPDFERLYSNVQFTFNTRKITLGKYWLDHVDRRQYIDGIVFDPSGMTSPGQYNSWKGVAISTNPKSDCHLFLEHLQTVICSGDQVHFEYFLNWLAFLVQKPWQLPLVAIVLRSDQGAGKGLLVQYIGRIFGRHFKHLTNKSHLVGNFSGHLHDAVLVFADELAWDKNKADTGILKGLITEKTRMMEKKGVDAVQVKNCAHLIIASNESWVVPAEVGDRRFFVLEVSSMKKDDDSYFDAFVAEMENGGPSGLLSFLLNRDISLFTPSNFPKTDARLNQQLQSLKPVDAWFHEQLENGYIAHLDEHGNLTGSPIKDRPVQYLWPQNAVTKALFEKYCSWHKARQGGNPEGIKVFTQTLRRYGLTSKKLSIPGSSRVNGYNFPDLATCRRNFDRRLDHPITWDDGI